MAVCFIGVDYTFLTGSIFHNNYITVANLYAPSDEKTMAHGYHNNLRIFDINLSMEILSWINAMKNLAAVVITLCLHLD